MKKVKNTIPVYDICSLKTSSPGNSGIMAEPFAAYLEVHPNLHLPHRHSFFHIVLFTKGSGFHTIDFEKFPVKPGQIYFMRPGQVHSWNFQGAVDGYVMNVAETFFDDFLIDHNYLDSFRFFQGSAKDSVIPLNKEVFLESKTIIEKIIAEVHTTKHQAHDLIRTCLVQLYIIINRAISGKQSEIEKPQNQIILHNFKKLLETYYPEKRLPKDYASMLYITPNHLNALSKDLIGKSAGEIIRDRILLEAKRLLINADIPILEIAIKLNFTDGSHFTRFFKKHTNTTPEEFRKRSFDNI
jgi:AraC-like DNA-binding protein